MDIQIQNVNVYMWLINHGYKLTNSTIRLDFWTKGNRTVIVPCDIRFPIRVISK